MTGVPSYSTTASENVNANTGINWDEGMSPAAVNNSARQNMADMRTQWNDASWFQYGTGSKTTVIPVYVSGTSFKVTGVNVTAYWTVGRRVKAVGSGTGTIYGTISNSVFSTDTTVTVVWDSGSLSNETLAIYAGTQQVTGQPVPIDSIGGVSKSWTPTDASGAGLSLTITGAGYSTIGPLTHVWGNIIFPSTVDATQICIGGLPATVKNTNGVGGGFPVLGLSTDNGQFVKNTTTFKIYQSNGTSRPNSGYSAGTFYFQAWYVTA